MPEINKRLHNVWGLMKNRCYNKNTPDYKNWGGRGITVCNKWLKYEGFVEDMYSSYQQGLTLDRIDNNKGYFKENCRWVTRKVQNNNRRDNNFIEWKGLRMTLPNWANKLGIKRSTLSQRLYTYKWSIEKCFTQEVQRRRVI